MEMQMHVGCTMVWATKVLKCLTKYCTKNKSAAVMSFAVIIQFRSILMI